MKRTLGILSICIGLVLGVIAFARHEDDKKILDLGKIELKDENRKPSDNTSTFYLLATILIVAGAVVISRK